MQQANSKPVPIWVPSYEGLGNDPEAWKHVADELLAGAHVLGKYVHDGITATPDRARLFVLSSQLKAPAYLLYAAAIEALLKGRAARRGHRFVVQGRFHPVPGTERDPHNLILLAKATRYRLSRKTRFLLQRLTYSLEMSRYPVPKTTKRHWPAPGISSSPLASWYSTDNATIRGLVKRLRSGRK